MANINTTLSSVNPIILEGRQEVLDLMSPTSPFANRAPPKFIRGKLYKYHFETGKQDKWWRREYQVRFSNRHPLPQSSLQTLQGEYLPALAADNEQLLTFLTNQGYIGIAEEVEDQQSLVTTVLAAIRALTKTVPPHVQIWSYAWLCLPPTLSLLINAASNK